MRGIGNLRDEIRLGKDHIGPATVDVVFEQHLGGKRGPINHDCMDERGIGWERLFKFINRLHPVGVHPDGDRSIAVCCWTTAATSGECPGTKDNQGEDSGDTNLREIGLPGGKALHYKNSFLSPLEVGTFNLERATMRDA